MFDHKPGWAQNLKAAFVRIDVHCIRWHRNFKLRRTFCIVISCTYRRFTPHLGESTKDFERSGDDRGLVYLLLCFGWFYITASLTTPVQSLICSFTSCAVITLHGGCCCTVLVYTLVFHLLYCVAMAQVKCVAGCSFTLWSIVVDHLFLHIYIYIYIGDFRDDWYISGLRWW